MEVLDAVLPAQTAGGATSVTVLGDMPSAESTATWVVGRLSLTSPTLVTGAATNFATINFRQVHAGSAVQTLGTLALNATTVTLPAETEVNVPITGTTPIPSGDTVDVQLVQSGTGLALPAGILARAEVS